MGENTVFYIATFDHCMDHIYIYIYITQKLRWTPPAPDKPANPDVATVDYLRFVDEDCVAGVVLQPKMEVNRISISQVYHDRACIHVHVMLSTYFQTTLQNILVVGMWLDIHNYLYSYNSMGWLS